MKVRLCLGYIMYIGRRADEGVNKPRLRINTNMCLHTEMPLVAFFGLVHLGITFPFLVRSVTATASPLRPSRKNLAKGLRFAGGWSSGSLNVPRPLDVVARRVVMRKLNITLNYAKCYAPLRACRFA